MTWDGKNRRAAEDDNGRPEDHDLLTRIDTNLTNFMKRFEDHIVEDKVEFTAQNKRIVNLEKIYAIGIACVVIFELVLRFTK